MTRKRKTTALAVFMLTVLGLAAAASAKVSATYLGSLIIGYDTTCGTPQTGALRYNTSTFVYSYCNGTAWVNF